MGRFTGRALQGGGAGLASPVRKQRTNRTWGPVKKLKLALNNPFIPVIIHFLKIPQLSKTATNSGPRVQAQAPWNISPSNTKSMPRG